MKISRHIHRQLRFKNLINTSALLAALIGLAWLSTLYPVHFDITAGSRNTLSSASQNVLNSLNDKIEIKAYIKKDPALRNQITQLIDRYKLHKSDIELTFIDPASEPERSRELEIPTSGAVFVEYQDRTERIHFIEESTLTNALQQLAGTDVRWISFLTGHGERSPERRANFDLSGFSEQLAQRNIKTQTLNLAEIHAIPDNSDLLIIASPQVDLLPGEIAILMDYLEKGGHLLWIIDPDSIVTNELANKLGVDRLPGMIVDAGSKLYGIDDPTFVLVGRYTAHPMTQNFHTLSLFPAVAALQVREETPFSHEAVLTSSDKSWTETGNGYQAEFDADSDEREGPLPFAYALNRQLSQDREQRIVAIGDGDFLANAYIGNVGNLELGLRMINWLLRDERYVAIPTQSAPDKTLQLSQTSVALLGFGFLLFVPLILLTTGLLIWRWRKRH